MALGSTQPLTEMSIRRISWGKCGRCVRLTTLPPSCAVVMKSGNLNFLEPFGPLQACNGIALPFTLQVDIAGLGLRRVRIANLPPELPDRILRETISKYGTVKGISEESWSKAYRYPVSNGIRIVELNLNLHKPSHMVIAGIRVLISYEGQPLTCYSCNGAGHQYNECPPKDEN